VALVVVVAIVVEVAVDIVVVSSHGMSISFSLVGSLRVKNRVEG